MDFDESLRYMEGLIRFGWKLGNERFEALCARMGNPERACPVVHVAGTKGKGSTTAIAASILRESGYHVGAYYSPYVYDVRERIQVDGLMVERDQFARLATNARREIEVLAQTELGQTTEFELKTLIGFLYFAERAVDFACIEVGIGGRLDATNVVAPDVTVITNIGLDHTTILGDTHAAIAAEKAGIIKPRVPCITAAANPEALSVIARIAAERDAPLIRVGTSQLKNTHNNNSRACDSSILDSGTSTSVYVETTEPGHFSAFDVVSGDRSYSRLEMRMGGSYQRENAACAIAACEIALARHGVRLSDEAVRRALARTALPGRLSIAQLPDGPVVVLDGAHNTLAAEALAGPIDELRRGRGIRDMHLVVGMVGGHEPDGLLAAFAPGAARIYACKPDWKRGIEADVIAEAARNAKSSAERISVETFPSVRDAVTAALRAAGSDDLVLITGSFYTVGEAPIERLSAWRGTQNAIP